MVKTIILTVFLLIVYISKSLQLTVDCDYKVSKRWKLADGDPYTCFLTTLSIKSKLTVTNVTGTHLSGNTDGDVKALKIIGGCEIVPSGFGAIFPNIEKLSIWKANLKYISSNELEQFNNLREIWIYVNALEYLESKLFQYNPNVEVIVFNANNIKYIGTTFFDYLPNLQKAFFLYNSCINDDATTAEKLTSLKTEIKEKCALTEATKPSAITIDCEYKISSEWQSVKDPYSCTITKSEYKTKLSVLNATGTHLDGSTNNDVKALNIYGGTCEIIPSDLGSIFPNIEAFSVWNTSLQIVSSRDLQQFSNLREIWLYDNQFDYLESNLFEYTPKIEVVHFKRNKIQFIGGDFFKFLPNLRSISLGNNLCIDDNADNIATITSLKNEVKLKCTVAEPRGYTTISPFDGLTYWLNSTAYGPDDEGVGGFNTDALIDPSALKSLIG